MSKSPTGTHAARRFSRNLVLLAACLALPAGAAEPGYRDPEFSRFPFAAWIAQPRTQQIRWSVSVSPADLSTHQRLIFRVTATVDGRELEIRRNSGAFEALIEYTDSAGHVWQNHTAVDPARLRGMTSQYLELKFYAFVLPGDYTVNPAVCDPKTLEHSAATRKIHVGPLKSDPLPDAWKTLPPIELVPAHADPPDIWFLPETQTSLNLSVANQRPVHVQLLLNATPSQRISGSASALRDNMSVLIPALKILSRMKLLGGGTIDAALLDLTHRQIAFQQPSAELLDWASLRKFFLGATPGIVDVRTLEGQRRMLPFFTGEIVKRLQPETVVIVLSGPAFYEDQEPVETSPLPLDPRRQLIYIRFRTGYNTRRLPPALQNAARGGRFGRGISQLPPNDALIPPMREDDLQKAVEPFNARIFDAASNTRFRRILAAVVEQISRM